MGSSQAEDAGEDSRTAERQRVAAARALALELAERGASLRIACDAKDTDSPSLTRAAGFCVNPVRVASAESTGNALDSGNVGLVRTEGENSGAAEKTVTNGDENSDDIGVEKNNAEQDSDVLWLRKVSDLLGILRGSELRDEPVDLSRAGKVLQMDLCNMDKIMCVLEELGLFCRTSDNAGISTMGTLETGMLLTFRLMRERGDPVLNGLHKCKLGNLSRFVHACLKPCMPSLKNTGFDWLASEFEIWDEDSDDGLLFVASVSLVVENFQRIVQHVEKSKAHACALLRSVRTCAFEIKDEAELIATFPENDERKVFVCVNLVPSGGSTDFLDANESLDAMREDEAKLDQLIQEQIATVDALFSKYSQDLYLTGDDIREAMSLSEEESESLLVVQCGPFSRVTIAHPSDGIAHGQINQRKGKDLVRNQLYIHDSSMELKTYLIGLPSVEGMDTISSNAMDEVLSQRSQTSKSSEKIKHLLKKLHWESFVEAAKNGDFEPPFDRVGRIGGFLGEDAFTFTTMTPFSQQQLKEKTLLERLRLHQRKKIEGMDDLLNDKGVNAMELGKNGVTELKTGGVPAKFVRIWVPGVRYISELPHLKGVAEYDPIDGEMKPIQSFDIPFCREPWNNPEEFERRRDGTDIDDMAAAELLEDFNGYLRSPGDEAARFVAFYEQRLRQPYYYDRQSGQCQWYLPKEATKEEGVMLSSQYVAVSKGLRDELSRALNISQPDKNIGASKVETGMKVKPVLSVDTNAPKLFQRKESPIQTENAAASTESDAQQGLNTLEYEHQVATSKQQQQQQSKPKGKPRRRKTRDEEDEDYQEGDESLDYSPPVSKKRRSSTNMQPRSRQTKSPHPHRREPMRATTRPDPTDLGFQLYFAEFSNNSRDDNPNWTLHELQDHMWAQWCRLGYDRQTDFRIRAFQMNPALFGGMKNEVVKGLGHLQKGNRNQPPMFSPFLPSNFGSLSQHTSDRSQSQGSGRGRGGLSASENVQIPHMNFFPMTKPLKEQQASQSTTGPSQGYGPFGSGEFARGPPRGVPGMGRGFPRPSMGTFGSGMSPMYGMSGPWRPFNQDESRSQQNSSTTGKQSGSAPWLQSHGSTAPGSPELDHELQGHGVSHGSMAPQRLTNGSTASTPISASSPSFNSDAVAFLQDVGNAFRDKPDLYYRFLSLMVEFKKGKLSQEDIVEQVGLIFHGYPHLLSGFWQFL